MEQDLLDELHETRAWLDQMLAQLLETRDWTMDLGPDPMADIDKINGLRPRLLAAGISVPPFPDHMEDPMANMTAWRDFLNRLVTLN